MPTEETREIPLVISKMPVINGTINSYGTESKLNNGDTRFEIVIIIWLAFKIEIITEKRTINPPIIIIVFVAEEILSDMISPKCEGDIPFVSIICIRRKKF